ncbi:hypothetical protein, partial [Pseudophaeobacter leonis]|uniref:hypothetical protein n=1 Tax=Pseudophaeobacter leonis TaxID=1144477 RepID=UPI00111C73D3
MEPIDHPVSKYALGVLEGDIVAGDLVRMAYERHLMDLETGADRGLFFNCQAASPSKPKPTCYGCAPRSAVRCGFNGS